MVFIHCLLFPQCFYFQIPELEFEIPPESQRGTLSTVRLPKPYDYNEYMFLVLASSSLS